MVVYIIGYITANGVRTAYRYILQESLANAKVRAHNATSY